MTADWERRGWFAERDDEAPAESHKWRPVLQADGWLGELDGIWFETEAECIEWINTQVLGHGLLEA